MSATNLLAFLPYLKYLPLIISLISSMTDVVEENTPDGTTSTDKKTAAVLAIQNTLTTLGVTLSDNLIGSLVDSIVGLKNLLGRYKTKA